MRAEIVKKWIDGNRDKLNMLSPKELYYFRLVVGGNLPPLIKGSPGSAKTAILMRIASKLGWHYEDVRIAQMEEGDIIGLPEKVSEKGYFKYLPPKWTFDANQDPERPSLIVFEEINRGKQAVQNACFRVLGERATGDIHFHPLVFFAATGNKGEADGTFVSDMDKALKNRFKHVNHTLTLEEWEQGFANENVPLPIRTFLKGNPVHFDNIVESKESESSFATPRTWADLGEYIKVHASDPNDYRGILNVLDADTAISILGSTGKAFHTWLSNTKKLTIDDLLKYYTERRDEFLSMSRANRSEIFINLKSTYGKTPKSINQLSEKAYDNLSSFMLDIASENKDSKDEAVGFIKEMVDRIGDVDNASERQVNLIRPYKRYLENIT